MTFLSITARLSIERVFIAFGHSAASALIFGGVDPASVAKYLGHTSPQTTEKVYAHALEESRSRNSSIIGDFMFSNKPAPRREDKKEDVG